MKDKDILKKLQFSQDWLDLGIITQEMLIVYNKEYENETDIHTEHYRWRAFSDFLTSNKFLSSELIISLYRLGQTDPDKSMGGAMQRELLDRRDCPLEILELASKSNEKFLVVAANRAIERRSKASRNDE